VAALAGPAPAVSAFLPSLTVPVVPILLDYTSWPFSGSLFSATLRCELTILLILAEAEVHLEPAHTNSKQHVSNVIHILISIKFEAIVVHKTTDLIKQLKSNYYIKKSQSQLFYCWTVKPRLHQGNILPGNMLLVAGNMLPVSRQHVSFCIQQQTGNKLATIFLTATSNMLKATCCRATCCLV